MAILFHSFQKKKYIKCYSAVTTNKDIVWSYAIPKKRYISSVKTLADATCDLISKSRKDYYRNAYTSSRNVLSALKPCSINSVVFMKYLLTEENLSNKSVLESFKTENGSLLNSEYNRDTKTGRLRIVSGPNILRLKKEHRNILRSRFGDKGTLYYLDYRSLEPRVMLAINKPNQPIPLDVYSYILDTLGITTVSRDAAKTTVLAQLFGANEESLNLKNVDNAKGFVKVVSEFFEIDSFKQRLMREVKSSERSGFYNHYGRWIDCSDAKPYMLINYFIQSTAVDVAMTGFEKIIQLIANSEYFHLIIPTFILHDALILDVEHTAIKFLNELVEAGSNIEQFPGTKFYLECKRLK
jgi:hypothetical protein